MRQVRRRLTTAVAIGMLAAIGAALPTTAAPNDPILLVHGWRGNPATWVDTIAMFKAQGRTAVAIDLATEDNVKNAAQIRDFITAKGWSRVDLVSQSMGGLSARWYVKFMKPANVTVDAYVSLGAPQYGIWSACVLFSSAGGQMCPTRSFLRDLNAGDDTPGTAAWMTIASTGDWYVMPNDTRLDGGACHVTLNGVGHNDMDNSPAVFAHVLAGVDRGCSGTMR